MNSSQRRSAAPWRVLARTGGYALLAMVLNAGVQAAAWRDISGSYALTGADMLRSGKDEKSHFRVQLRGLTARDLYNAMQVETAVDQCTGARLKAAGNVRCIHFENTGNYQCDFAIDLAGPSIEVGIPC